MLKNKNEGKFIVIEGLDGSGLSTMSQLLGKYLEDKKIEVLVTKEPTDNSEAGKRIKEVIDKKAKVPSADLQKFFANDRFEHLDKVIIPALAEGKFVISDRYFFSSFAFGTAEGLDLDWLIRLNDGFLYPDLTIFLKVNPETCIKRIEARRTPKALFELQEKLAKTWETYEILPDRFENIVIIDGEGEINEVFERVKDVVEKRILEKIALIPKLR